MELRGTKGTMYLYLNRWEVVPEKIDGIAVRRRGRRSTASSERSYGQSKKAAMEPRSGSGSIDTAFHARNFLDCVKSRGKCNCDILTGHISTSSTIIGNIALKHRAVLEWDGDRGALYQPCGSQPRSRVSLPLALPPRVGSKD